MSLKSIWLLGTVVNAFSFVDTFNKIGFEKYVFGIAMSVYFAFYLICLRAEKRRGR